MDNLNIGFVVSSVLAVTGLGVYLYMNNTDDNSEHVTHEISNEADIDENENENDNIKTNKKSVSVKTKRRLNKTSGTRRKR